MIRTVLLLVSAMLACAATPVAHAQAAAADAIPTHPALTDRFSFDLGGFYTRTTTSASLGPSGGGSALVVNFEDALGLDSRNLSGIAGFLWRFGERWRLEVEYFSLDRSATRSLAADVTWGDTTFAAGTTLTSMYDFSDIRVGVGYSFFKRRDKELGIGAGLHVAGIKTKLQGAVVGAESSDVTAPLPVLNMYGAFALTDEWAVRMRVDWLSLTYGDFSGDIRNVAIDVLYQPFRHVGFGLGVRSLVLNIEIDKSDWQGKARTVFSGPTVFMTVTF